MHKYRARVSKYILDQYKDRICLFGISIGNTKQAGEKLEATIKLINENFDECLIGLSDTMQIPNHMAKGLSYEGARGLCIKQRNEWLSENSHILKKLTIPYKIQFWDETMSLPCKYGGLKNYLKEMYETDTSFKGVIDQDVNKFVSRNSLYKGKEHFCREFLFEELDGYSRIGQAGKYIKLYPSKNLASLDALMEGKFPKITLGHKNIQFATIYFDKISRNNNKKNAGFKLAA
jgi:hypothetical protein